MIGEVIDEKYKITRLIGEGGMGAVYEGENLLINRRVAIKVLHAAMALNQETVQRFQREARAAGRIGNDHILEVLDLGRLPNGDHYMVLEYLDGETLSDRIERLGKLTPEQLAPVMTQVLAGLAAAHNAGIVHRDLKPDNIFILKEKAGHKDFVKIIDFGISKFSPLSGEDAKRMTSTGAIMGTPYYMSPEQARGSVDADARSDLYSIGVIIYEAITGKVPFDGRTVNELMFNIALSEATPVREVVPDIDPGFEEIVTRSMAKDREARYQSAEEFLSALSDWYGGPSRLSAVSGEPVGYTGSMPQEVIEQTSQVNAGKGAAGATRSTWATSQADEPAAVPTRSSMPLFIGLGIVAVLVAGGGFFAVRSISSSDAATAGASMDAGALTANAGEPQTDESDEPTTAEGEPEAAAKDEAEASGETEEETEEDSEAAQADDQTDEPTVAPAAQPAPKPAPKPVSRPTPRPKPASRPAPKPKPAPSKPAKDKPGKRKPRLQFGY